MNMINKSLASRPQEWSPLFCHSGLSQFLGLSGVSCVRSHPPRGPRPSEQYHPRDLEGYEAPCLWMRSFIGPVRCDCIRMVTKTACPSDGLRYGIAKQRIAKHLKMQLHFSSIIVLENLIFLLDGWAYLHLMFLTLTMLMGVFFYPQTHIFNRCLVENRNISKSFGDFS